MKTIYQIIIFLLITSFSGCVSTQSSMSANSDEDQDIGLGGTGMLANNTGGYGLGGTGIVGEVTGFGSIFVNGIEVEYDTNTPFTINGKKSSHQQLVIGDIVEILTTNANVYTDAQIINVRHEVIGKVDSVNKLTDSFTIQGQTIIQVKNNMLPDIGDSVAVAGLRVNKQTIQATRISSANGQSALLRTDNELPFNTLTKRWLIQTHVKTDSSTNSKVALQIDAVPHIVTFMDNAKASISGLSETKILQLKKSSSGNIEFVRKIDTLNMPRGSSTPVLNKKTTPSHMQMRTRPQIPRRGR